MLTAFKLNSNFALSVLYWALLMVASHSLAWATSLSIGSSCSFSFAVKAESIYFQPFFDSNFLPAPNSNEQMPFTLQPGGPGKKNKFNYTPGWRLSVLCFNSNACSLFENGYLRFTHLSAHHFRRVNLNSFLSALVTSSEDQANDDFQSDFSDFLTSHHNLDYYAADLCATLSIFYKKHLSFSVQPGIHYAFMCYQNRVHLSSKNEAFVNSANLKEKSQTWGIGPQLGFKLDYRLGDCLTIRGGIAGGLLLSRASARFYMDPFNPIKNPSDLSSHGIHPRSLWKAVPFWETTLALSTSFLMYGHLVEMEMGYEYLSYPDFINRIQFPSNGSRRADNIFSNFDFQGPYVSVMLKL